MLESPIPILATTTKGMFYFWGFILYLLLYSKSWACWLLEVKNIRYIRTNPRKKCSQPYMCIQIEKGTNLMHQVDSTHFMIPICQ